MRDAQLAPLDPGVEYRIAAAAEYRRQLAVELADLLGPEFLALDPDTPAEQRREQTQQALQDGVRYLYAAALPNDPASGRSGSLDLLVRTDDGYVPVLIVRHKTADPGHGASVSPLIDPVPGAARVVENRKPRAQPRDLLRLSHATRLLQACGYAGSRRLLGGVIGAEADGVLWHDLEAAHWPEGRSALDEYDQRFADRLAVATAAFRGDEPRAQPSRIMECKDCPWWSVCGPQLRSSRDVSLVVRGEDAVLLRELSVSTIDDLAQLPAETAAKLPFSEQRTNDVVLLAKAWLSDLSLVRRVREVAMPRADIEVDVDMESYVDAGAYLWGTWLSGPALEALGELAVPGYRAFRTWEPLPSDDEGRSFGEFWTWLSAVRTTAAEQGLTFRAYCYNELAENRWMLSSAERFAGKPGIPSVGEVQEFITSDDWIDMFALVNDQFLCPNGKGLKVIAPSAGFQWRDPMASGENSMRWYREAVALDGGEPAESQRERLLRYNEDDVKATFALRQWMSSAEVQDLPYAEDL